ncbi:MAG: hypothetical protein OEW37_00005 [Rhodospirillaceae bacterium]|nr:hypothetical protein [Rhodospirillaceae bacterium]
MPIENLSNPSNIELIKLGIGFVMAGLLGLLGFTGKRQIKRIDKIETNYVQKREFNDSINALRNDFKESASDVKSTVRDVNERLDRLLFQTLDKKD